MKKIEILGMGCANCNKLYQNALVAVKMSGQEAQVNKVEDIQKIMAYGSDVHASFGGGWSSQSGGKSSQTRRD